ncbi:hypothetical protein [Bacteroides sp. 519]|uniref:hypothetical protein n=1 Tax=Bacteroides sp. 519 TaxID=2302937 RepID=UPI0013D6A1E0|nr:hypothetical protein [Bacteroides sp. 519]NDV59505.1 hypothetical protein [Bacteroides sp. 519]
MRRIILLSIILFSAFSTFAQTREKRFSLIPGIFCNSNFLSEDVTGFGGVLGLEYMKHKEHFFSIELRTKYGYYVFDDGTKWKNDGEGGFDPPKNPGEARVEYGLFSPQVGVVPKFYLHLEDLSLFLENEFITGLITGKVKYQGYEKKIRISEPIFSYNIGVGAIFKISKNSNSSFAASIGYSTLNLRSKIRRNQPLNHPFKIPDQDAIVMINLVFKVPL